MSPQQIPQPHRDAIAQIQALAMAISIQGTYWVGVQFSGMLLRLHVDVNRCADLYAPNSTSSTYCVTLPPCNRAEPDSLEQLQAVARELEALLPGMAS
ncbi:hypothetical protein [Vreelandella sp. TE19]